MDSAHKQPILIYCLIISYLIRLEWVIEAFHYCALQCTVVHYSAILRFLRFLCFLCYFFTFFAWFGFILSYWSPTNTKITFSLLKQTNEFWHLLFRFIRHLLLYSSTSFTSFTSASSGRLSSIFFDDFPKESLKTIWKLGPGYRCRAQVWSEDNSLEMSSTAGDERVILIAFFSGFKHSLASV